MKKVSFMCLLICMMMGLASCSSCTADPPEGIAYNLCLSFKDGLGKDLVEGIEIVNWYPQNVPMKEAQMGEVKPGTYWWNVSLDKPHNPPALLPDKLIMVKMADGVRCLRQLLSLVVSEYENQNKITYRLVCPHIFGDQKEHEITAYWTIQKTALSTHYARCYRAEFDGKEISEIKYSDGDIPVTLLTLVLE